MASMHHTRSDIEAMIAQDPNRPGVERVRLVEYGVPVWAIVAHLQALTGSDIGDEVDPAAVAQTASDYHLPDEAVVAAVAYNRRHRPAIDALLARNAAAVA